jgi:protein-disulfide isomerase
VAVEHRDFPLPKHAWAKRAAVAARFFEQQKPETGVAFRRYAMAHLREITVANFEAKLREFAKGHGVDGAKAVAALDDAKLIALVEEDYQEGVARGVAKTPSVFVNGEPFIETFTLEAISKSIDAAIAENKL